MLVTKYSGLSGLVTAKSSATRLLGKSGTFDFQIDPPGEIEGTTSCILEITLNEVSLIDSTIWSYLLNSV